MTRTQLFAQTAGDRGERASLQLEMSAQSLMSVDTLVRGSASPYEIYKILKSSGAIEKAIESLPDDEQKPDAIVFFNGARNLNDFCIVDGETGKRLKYCIDAETIIIVWLDDQPEDRYQVGAEVEQEKSSFMKDLLVVGELALKLLQKKSNGFGFAGEELPENFPQYSITAEVIKIPSPSEVTITLKQLSKVANSDSAFQYGDFNNILSIGNGEIYFYTKTEIVLHNYDKQYFGFSLGLSSVSVNSRSISPNPEDNSFDDVVKNSNSKIQAAPIVLFYLQAGRESAWDPTWEFWRGEFYQEFWKRLSLRFGFELNNAPFDRLFSGLGLSVTKNIDLVGGLAYEKTAKPQSHIPAKQVGNLSNLDTHYEPQWFLGFAFKPSFFVKILGGE